MNLKLELEEGIRVLISNLKHKSEVETELWEARKIKERLKKRLNCFSFIVLFVRKILNVFF
jgi:hypothetical protein